MSLDSHLIHRCTIERAGKAVDAYRNTQLFYGPYLRDVPCRLIEKTERVVQSEQAQLLAVKTFSLLVGPDTDLQEEDRISGLLLEDGLEDTRTFYARQIVTRRTRGARHRLAVLEAIGGPAQ